MSVRFQFVAALNLFRQRRHLLVQPLARRATVTIVIGHRFPQLVQARQFPTQTVRFSTRELVNMLRSIYDLRPKPSGLGSTQM